MVALPVGAGLLAWHWRPDQRFGKLLVLTGFAWFLSTLAESGDEVLYSIGRVAGWMVELSLVYLLLSFPTGRLTDRVDRGLVWAAGALVAVLYLPTALLTHGYPTPSPFTSCRLACPDNAFMTVATEPAWVDSAVRPLREVLTVLIFGSVIVRLARRERHATPLLRRTLEPVLFVAILRLAAIATALVARAVDPDAPVVVTLAWIAALGLPVMAVGFAAGLVRQRVLVADAVVALGERMHAGVPASELGPALAGALADPSLRLVHRDPDEPGALPPVEPGRHVTRVCEGETELALIVHDEALFLYQPELLDAAVSFTRIALENERLTAQVSSSLGEIDKSRSRIQAAADEERRRIERDLHDGAQQRLVALRIKLELTEELVRTHPSEGLPKLHRLGEEVTETLDDIRSIARGVYPSLLEERGLPEALHAAALRATTATRVSPDGVGRYSQAIESAVYFCCLEALQNAAKHAPGATEVTINLHQDDQLRFEVTDDGQGFDTLVHTDGAGLTNMRDRVEAVGGSLVVSSTPGRGSVVSGSVPLQR